MVQRLASDSFDNFKDNRQAVLFFFRECKDDDWFKDAGISYEKQLIALINIVELTYREIIFYFQIINYIFTIQFFYAYPIFN